MNISKKVFIIFLSIISASLVILLNLYVDFNFGGHFEGIYLVKEKTSRKYELSDHLFVGREKQLVFAMDFTNKFNSIERKFLHKHSENNNHLHCDWNPKDGSGVVNSYFSDGTVLVTYLGRYLDDEKEVHGLFVGGGLPETVESYVNYNMNNSGMTFFDGRRWYHIWCSVNEGIGSAVSGNSLTPSHWEFLGSGVEKRSSDKVTISSSHKTVIDNVPVRIERRMHFTAGQTYFNLEITITNIGTTPFFYSYLYGDEPWVGYYGTSLGDVGWVKDRVVNYEELLDTTKYSYVGMSDIGNKVIGEKPVYTNLANFLEWYGPERPMYAYFTNDMNRIPEKDKKVPLESSERFVGLIWERRLAPSESSTIRLAVGMALHNPKTGIPEKPSTRWE